MCALFVQHRSFSDLRDWMMWIQNEFAPTTDTEDALYDVNKRGIAQIIKDKEADVGSSIQEPVVFRLTD